MIYKLDIKDPTKTPISWLPKVAALAQPRTFEFKPGLNILWGANGVGKSTIITLLARVFHCAQGGQPTVTQTSVSVLELDDGAPTGIEITHDGQGVQHFDAGRVVGVMGGSFDDDFMFAGLLNATFRGSAGETTLMRFTEIFDHIITGTPAALTRRIHAEDVNSLWRARLKVVDQLLAANAPMGPPTTLLDEPDRSCDLAAQHRLWRFLRTAASDAQFIVASHAVFALTIPEANYIELVPGTLAPARQALAELGAWPAEPRMRLSPAAVAQARQRLTARRR